MNKNDENNKSIDITHVIREAASSLSYQNPCLAEKSFNLYDSMSALDLMEPKMDGCEIDARYYLDPTRRYCEGIPNTLCTRDSNSSSGANGNTTGICDTVAETNHVTVPPRPIPSGLSTCLSLPWSDENGTPLTVAKTRIILVEMLVRIESLLAGNSIGETVYTCLYAHNSILLDMHRHLKRNILCDDMKGTNDRNEQQDETNMTSRLLQETVYASTRLMLKLAETIVNIVQRADIYQEEDFTFHHYHRSCNPCYDFGRSLEQAITQDGDSVYADLYALVGEIKQKWSDWVSSFPSLECDSSKNVTARDDERDGKMVCFCLDVMVHFLEACHVLSSLTKDNIVENVQMLQGKIFDNLLPMRELVSLLNDDNGEKQQSQPLQQDMEKHQPKNLSAAAAVAAETIFSAFDPYMNRPLLGNTPVRQVAFSLPMDAVQNLACIYQQLESSLCTLLLKGNTLGRIQRILSNLSSPLFSSSSLSSISDVQSPNKLNILCRSLIVINLYLDDLLLGQYDFSLLIAEDMYLHAVPRSIFSLVQGKHYLERLCKPFYDILKLYTLNRNRQRAFMDIVMFQEWNKLQAEAATVDVCFQQELGLAHGHDDVTGSRGGGNNSRPVALYMSNYILSTKLGLMEHHIGLGIELGLFHGHYHLLTAFWYREFLLSARLSILSAMKEQLEARKAMEEQIRQEEHISLEQEKLKLNKGKKKGKKKSSKVSKKLEKDNSSQVLHSTSSLDIVNNAEENEQVAEYIYWNVKRMLCRGCVRVSTVLPSSVFFHNIMSMRNNCVCMIGHEK